MAVVFAIVCALLSWIPMALFNSYLRFVYERDGRPPTVWFDRGAFAATLVVMALSAAFGSFYGSLMDSREAANMQEWKDSLSQEDIVVTDIEVFMQYRFVTTPEHPERLVVRYPSMEIGDVEVGKRYHVWTDKSYVHFIEPLPTAERSNEDGETTFPEGGL